MKKRKLTPKEQALKDMKQTDCNCTVFRYKKEILSQPKLTIRHPKL